jgi:hypothetical protein
VFRATETLALTRAWMAVAEDLAAYTLSAELKRELGSPSCAFWTKVQARYATSRCEGGIARSANELLRHWQATLRSLSTFLALFECEYFASRRSFRDDGACVEQALDWAVVEYRHEKGEAFQLTEEAALLTSHRKWWSVLKPLIALQKEVSVGDEEASISPEVPQQEMRVRAHPRSEDEAEKRRVRPRLDSEELALTETTPVVLLSPVRSTGVEVASSPKRTCTTMADEVALRKVEVMERRLELEIMTRSEDGLSPEAVEYVRWQRQLVLIKMREQMRPN